jgi:GrpB-like predicted nucleotidyltransferase (UPF0157 family)
VRTIVVVGYDPRWPEIFEQLRSRIWSAIQDVAVSIEHVGSTSVPGLAAKPIIDMSAVVRAESDVPAAIQRLSTLGYEHQGDLGVKGREAFIAPNGLPPHHLYLCPTGSLALSNHLAVRDYLRTHADIALEYGALKKKLALEFANDIDGYMDGKTDMLLGILRKAGLRPDELAAIERINKRADERCEPPR